MASSGWGWGPALGVFCKRSLSAQKALFPHTLVLNVDGSSGGLMAHMASVLEVCPHGCYELVLEPRGPCVPVCHERREVTLGKLALWGGSEEMGLKCLWAFRDCCASTAL